MSTWIGKYLYNGYGCRIRLEVDVYYKQTKRGVQLYYEWNERQCIISRDDFENGGWFLICDENSRYRQLELFK